MQGDLLLQPGQHGAASLRPDALVGRLHRQPMIGQADDLVGQAAVERRRTLRAQVPALVDQLPGVAAVQKGPKLAHAQRAGGCVGHEAAPLWGAPRRSHHTIEVGDGIGRRALLAVDMERGGYVPH